MKIINYEKKEMIQLTDEENKFSEEQKFCYICKKEFSNDDDDNKKYQKEIIVITLENLEELLIFVNNICTLRYKTPKKIPVVFHNGSIYDYHFIINQLAKKIKGQLKCFGKNTEKNITFSVTIKENLIMVKQLHTN